MACSMTFYNPGTPVQRGSNHSGLCPHQLTITNVLQGQSDEGNSSIEGPPPRCVSLTTKAVTLTVISILQYSLLLVVLLLTNTLH